MYTCKNIHTNGVSCSEEERNGRKNRENLVPKKRKETRNQVKYKRESQAKSIPKLNTKSRLHVSAINQ